MGAYAFFASLEAPPPLREAFFAGLDDLLYKLHKKLKGHAQSLVEHVFLKRKNLIGSVEKFRRKKYIFFLRMKKVFLGRFSARWDNLTTDREM